MSTTLEQLSVYAGLLSPVVSGAVWFKLQLQKEFNQQRIVISLVIPGSEKKITLPCRIERKHLTRAEVMGVLGVLPMVEEGKRYDIQFFNSVEFYARLENAQDLAEQTELLIECTEQELEQFNLEKMKISCTVVGF